jgi:hypothetical protein
VVSEAGWNSIWLPDSLAMGSAVPYRQPLGTAQGGLVLQVVGLGPLRIEQHLVPIQHRQFAGGGGARSETAGFGRRDEIEGDVERRYARRYVQVKGVHIDAIAFPRDALASALYFQADQIHHRPSGAVLPGNPLGIEQRQGAGLCRHGNLHVKQPAGRVGGVHPKLDRSLAIEGSRQGSQ